MLCLESPGLYRRPAGGFVLDGRGWCGVWLTHGEARQGQRHSSGGARGQAGDAQSPEGLCQAGSGDGWLHLQSLSREQVRDSDGVTNSAGGLLAQIRCHGSAVRRRRD